MEISDRIRIRMTVRGFWPTVYIRCICGLNRIWTIFAGGAAFDSQQSFWLFFVDFLFYRAYSY